MTMILKTKQGEVRLVWRLFLLVAPFLLAAYLLRYVPIRVQMGILVRGGLSESAAASQARHLFLEDPVGVSMVGILQGLLWYGLVCALIRFIEKRSCTLKSFGLSLNGKTVMRVALGLLLGVGMYLGYLAVDWVLDPSALAWSPTNLGVLPLILVTLDMLANGFGEETAFRAYWQKLLVDRHGLWWGILIASASFVLLHLLVAQLTVMAILAGILLACTFGLLYVWTESVFLVGTMHALFNLAPRLLGQWPSDTSLLVVNGLALVIMVVLYLRVGKMESSPEALGRDTW